MREYKTAGTPSSMVSGSASPRLRPTGIKSAPTCASMAKRAGRAYCGGICPNPISAPKSVPITCAITAPGPRTGEIKGRAHTSAKINIPGKDAATGEMVTATTLPTPVAVIIPKIMLTKAIKGKILLMVISIDSLPAA